MNLKRWMRDLPDSCELFSLNLVGTHDCVTQYVQLSHFARCQDRSIYDQLCLGIRALDIRVSSKGSRLVMVHGITKAFNKPNHFSKQMDMSDVLADCFRFLEENKSEAIIFQFKNDSGAEQEKCFDNLKSTYINCSEDKWFLENRSPILGEARGKIVLVRRCKAANRPEYDDTNIGIDFSKWVEQDTAVPDPLTLRTSGKNEMTFIIQDRYKYKPVPRWNDCIMPFLNSMTDFNGTYVINYFSTAGGLKGPYNNAKYINRKFLSYPLEKSRYYGIIYVDFPSRELVEKIIETNWSKYENN